MSFGSPYLGDIYLPNTYWSEDQCRLLSFPEVQDSEIRDYIMNAEFAGANLKVVRPAPDQIVALTQEMLDRLDGTARYDELDRALQDRWRQLLFARLTPLTRGTLSSVSRDYLRRNQGLLDEHPGAG